MTCDNCKIHQSYLERIIKIQDDHIEFLKHISCNKQSSNKTEEYKKCEEKLYIEFSIFDIIEYKKELLDIDFITQELNNTFPAKDNIMNVIQYFIYEERYKNIIQINKINNNVRFLNKRCRRHFTI